jgi:AcrR family transcriptional regulator
MNKDLKEEKKLDRKKRRSLRNRKKIKESGLDVFAEKGVCDARIEDITETADLGKGTFYSHFESKDVLFAELLEDSVQKLIGLIETGCGKNDAKDIRSTLEGLLDAHLKLFKDYYENFILIFQGQGMLNLQKEDDHDVLEPILRYIKTIENCLHPHLKASMPSKKLRKLASAVAGFVSGYFSFITIGLDEKAINGIFLKPAFLEAMITFLEEA